MSNRQAIERLEIEDPFNPLIDADRTQRYSILSYGPQHYYPRAVVFDDERVGRLVTIVMSGMNLHDTVDRGGLRAAPAANRIIKDTQELRPAIYFSSMIPDPESPSPYALTPLELTEAGEAYILKVNGVLRELGSSLHIPR